MNHESCMRAKLSIEVVEKVELLLKEGYTYSKIHNITKVSKSTISKIKNGNYKKFEREFVIEDEPKYRELKKENEDLREKIKKLECEYEKLKESKIVYLDYKFKK